MTPMSVVAAVYKDAVALLAVHTVPTSSIVAIQVSSGLEFRVGNNVLLCVSACNDGGSHGLAEIIIESIDNNQKLVWYCAALIVLL